VEDRIRGLVGEISWVRMERIGRKAWMMGATKSGGDVSSDRQQARRSVL